MDKTVYVGEKDGKKYLEITGKDRDGVAFRRRTNDIKKIETFLNSEGKQFLDGIIREKNLILHTANGIRLVLRNYQKLQEQEPFQKLFDRLYNTPFLPKNIERGQHSNIFQILGLKLHYANKTKIAALTLTGAILVTGVSFTTTRQSNGTEPEQIITEIDTLSTLETDMNPEQRLQKTMKMKEQYQEYDNTKIMLGAKVDQNRMEEILASNRGKTIFSIAQTYGIDPYLLIAKGIAESNLEHEACCPGGFHYNGYGVGAWQLENPNGRTVTAWNYERDIEETLEITMENAVNFEKNAQAAAMYLQNRLNLYNGNVYLALQSYNYGLPMMNIVVHDYAKKIGATEEEVKNNLQDLGWLEIVQDVHENPNNYYYRAAIGTQEQDPVTIMKAKKDYVWKNKTYGNDHYISDVLSYYVGEKSENKNQNGTSYITDLTNNEVIEIDREQTNRVNGKVKF